MLVDDLTKAILEGYSLVKILKLDIAKTLRLRFDQDFEAED